MSNENKSGDGGKNNDFKASVRPWIIWLAILGFVPILIMLRDRAEPRRVTLSYTDFINAVESDRIVSGEINYNPQASDLRMVTGRYKKLDKNGKPVLDQNGEERVELFKIKIPITPTLSDKLLATGKFDFVEPNTLLVNLFFTFLPFVFLLLLAGISPNVRSHLMSPLVAAAVCVGVVLNIIGRRWVHTLISRAVSVSPDQGLQTTIASTIALHLCAGGSVTDAFGALASIHPVCARVNSLLRNGHLISESLVPLEEVAPTVVRCILDAHRDGLPVNESMMRIADDLRASSFAHIQSRIAEVAVRSTTPLVLCTLPSFLLIGIAPLALAALAGLSAPTM